MGTLYDLLGALPNDDAEGLRTAFRKAAKATHPDLNPDNPEAALRFRQLVRAHDILSDAEQRATYDQLLAVATKLPPAKSKHVYEKVQRFASSTIAATIISGVLVAAYTLMGPVPPAPVAAESTVGIAGRTPADVAATGKTAGESAPRAGATLASEVFSTGSLASGASTKAWIAGAGPVPHVAGNEAKSEPAIEVSLGTSKPPTLTDLQRDLGFLPLYSTRDVSRAFADMERTRRIAKTRQARAAEARASTAMVLEAPPVLRLRRTRMTQAITP
jgi:curved DNA-binding protein CbpA